MSDTGGLTTLVANQIEVKTDCPCFTPGTRIATARGERRVETLKIGDRVITRDNGIQAILGIGTLALDGYDLIHAPHLNPVLIQQGALGQGLPERDMLVSQNHRILVTNDKSTLFFEGSEVLVVAKHLTGLKGVDVVGVSHTTYIQLIFETHEVVLSDGIWTESFQPVAQSVNGVGNAERQEGKELYKELERS